jgi:hypothetical protein
MSSTHSKVNQPAIIPADAAGALDRLGPDLTEWPLSWQVEESDVIIGRYIIEVLKPFLYELLRKSLADQTLLGHRDHLWMLGGEIIRRRHDDPELCKQPVRMLIFNLIEEEGGPLIWPRISESQQNSFDATCRKLYRFLQQGEIP